MRSEARSNIEQMVNVSSSDCASTSIIRASTKQELLYTRSRIVVAAKAFGLDAIDMASLL